MDSGHGPSLTTGESSPSGFAFEHTRRRTFEDMTLTATEVRQLIESTPPDQLPALTQAMLDRGYDELTILKVLGGNYLRVFDAVWT